MIPVIPTILMGVVQAITQGLINSPQVPVNETNQQATERVVEQAVRQEVEPVIDHLTNNEPWYQSRVTLGALSSIISALAIGAGYAISPNDITEILVMIGTIGPGLGGILSLVGRWMARKPLGA